jgi:hypothetical protein
VFGTAAAIAGRAGVGVVGMMTGLGSAVGRMGPQIPLMMRISGAMNILATAGIRTLTVGLVELAIAFWPVTLAVAALGVAFAWLIAKWDGVKAFFAGIGKGFMDSLSPQTRAAISQVGEALKGVFTMIGAAVKPVADAVKAVFEWVGKFFAPANVPAWQKTGEGFGGVLASMVNGLVDFISKIVEARAKIVEFFSYAANVPIPSAAAMPRPAVPPRGNPVPGRALGGWARRGHWYRINENGQELFSPGVGGRVISARTSAAMMAAANVNSPRAANGNSSGPVTFNIYGATDPREVVRQVDERLRHHANAQRGGLYD